MAYKVILYPEEIKGIVQYLVLENGWGEKQGNPKLGLFENCRGDNLQSEKGVIFLHLGETLHCTGVEAAQNPSRLPQVGVSMQNPSGRFDPS